MQGTAAASTISVIIPFFQREAGILTQALKSVQRQSVPAGWTVEVIVVDDGSPVNAEDDIRSLQFGDAFRLKTIRKENGGVGSARNRGLLEADKAAKLVAFLDSDDMWPLNHLARAIRAMEEGFDFYFTDNKREGHHESHCRSPYVKRTATYVENSGQTAGLLEIPKDLMIGLTLSEFPCQASTVVYARGVNDGLSFDVRLRSSGEDVLFFTSLVSSANRICFDLDGMVECGGGVNIYFASLAWNSENLLSIKVDILVAHRRIAQTLNLSACNAQWNYKRLNECRKDLAFHMLRNLPANPMRALREMRRLVGLAPAAAIVLPIDMLRVARDRLCMPREGKWAK